MKVYGATSNQVSEVRDQTEFDYYARANSSANKTPVVSTMKQEVEYIDFSPHMRPNKKEETAPVDDRPFNFSRYEEKEASPPKFFIVSDERRKPSTYVGGVGPTMMNNEMPKMESPTYAYANSVLSKYSNGNNSNNTEVTGNRNNNYPNYDQMYNAQQAARQAQERRQMEESRQRQEAEISYAYGGNLDFRGGYSPAETTSFGGNRGFGPMESQPNVAAAWQQEDQTMSFFSDVPSPQRLTETSAVSPQPKMPVRPMLMKLGHITVRNNVENDGDYAANINMDLKGSPGAYPVPLDERGNPIRRAEPKENTYTTTTYSADQW